MLQLRDIDISDYQLYVVFVHSYCYYGILIST